MKPIYRGMTKDDLDKAGFCAGVIMILAVFGNLSALALLLLLGEAFLASELACEQINLIRQHYTESGLLGEPCGNKSFDLLMREHSDSFSAPANAPNQNPSVELANASVGNLNQCVYCDTRNTMPVTRGDCLDALYDAFFSPGDPVGAQLVRCGHNPDRKDECRADRGGVHWQAAVAAFNLRRSRGQILASRQNTP